MDGEGAAPSKNAFVEQALSREIEQVRRAKRRADYEAAVQDALFLQDVRQVEHDFRFADVESIPESR